MKPINYMYALLFSFVVTSVHAQKQEKEEPIYNVVEVNPAFRGNLDSFLLKELGTPPQPRFHGDAAYKAFFQLIIYSDGKRLDVDLMKGTGSDSANARIKRALLKTKGLWEPGHMGTISGTPLSVKKVIIVAWYEDKGVFVKTSLVD